MVDERIDKKSTIEEDASLTEFRSNMGDFVHKLLRGQESAKSNPKTNLPADYQTVELPTRFTQKGRKHKIVQEP